VRCELPNGALVGNWDGDRLRQVLLNLLGNAMRYSPEGGTIVVRVNDEHAALAARVAVSDQGVGIPPEDQARLFSRFYRAEATLSAGEGLGLGLYISRSLVEAHGGRIWAESEPGRGSTFTFTLPYG
jgi:signal transduction histidine kinase